jgi:uncharacterized membrane protein YbhN (UPF0104 family)
MQTTELQKEDTEMKKFLEGLGSIVLSIVIWIVMFGCIILGLIAHDIHVDAIWYILIGIVTLAISTAIANDEGY